MYLLKLEPFRDLRLAVRLALEWLFAFVSPPKKSPTSGLQVGLKLYFWAVSPPPETIASTLKESAEMNRQINPKGRNMKRSHAATSRR